MENQFPYSPAKIANVRAVQFSILSPDEIRQMSVSAIMRRCISRKSKGGLSDPLLGSGDWRTDCETCSATDECPGHFGHLELARPMFHIGFMKTVLTIMRCVCFNCSKILADEEEPQFKEALRIRNPKSRLKRILEVCKNRTKCEGGDAIEVHGLASEQPVKRSRGGCGAQQPKLTTDGMNMVAEYKAEKKKNDDWEQIPELAEQKKLLSAENVLNILKRISDEDCKVLGLDPKYARPDWMILQVLPIPPPPVRPSVVVDAFTQSEDDLTRQLSMIVRLNKNLKTQEENGAPPHIISDFEHLLQFYIATYFDNELPGLPRVIQRSGRPIKSICTRLEAKEGQRRGNLGKRVDFSARTVITPDPNINIDELGVPPSIALNLTYPEIVTPYNILRLEELVENGADPPPGTKGANYIITNDGERVDLSQFNAASYTLELGYKVERHLIDGDYVLVNQLPSLHKMSIMGHKIKLLPHSTFRLNSSVASAYNANLDGDEMNMYVPQSFETIAEVLELMMVPKCIVSPQSNRPVMGVVQDTLLGSYKITQRDTFIEKDVIMNMLILSEDFDGRIPAPAILKPRPLWTGKQVFNLIIPKQINLLKNSSEKGYITPGDAQVRIEKGELLSGTLCKKTLGTSTGSLIHVIWQDVGPEAAHKFLIHTQWLVNHWLLQNGFSIGILDTIVDAATMEKINNTISNAKDEVKELMSAAQAKRLEAEPGRTMMESLETRVNKILNKASDEAGSIALKSLTKTNNLKAMATAGSNGNFINISQMTACVGQQNVEGKRIPYGFRDRTLPHFSKDDYGPESRGFVENSYIRGLTPQEFFFHAMGAREGLIDTTVKTCTNGYIQRQLVKAMEDIMVKYDGTVRNSLGDVIQFIYGEDGMDAIRIESQNLDLLKLKRSDFYKTYRYEIDDTNWNPTYLLPEYVDELKSTGELRNVLEAEVQKLEADRYILGMEIVTKADNSWPLPVSINRLISNAQKTFKVDFRQSSDMRPVEIVEAVDKLQERLKVVNGDDSVSLEAQKNATLLFDILLRSTLASKRVLKEYRLTREAFEWVLGEIESRFFQSLVVPGEMVGCIAAQSIGEPNKFHYSGVSVKNVTLGVPRLQEIINVAKKIKNPSLSVYLMPEVGQRRETAENVQCALEYTTLRSVTEASEVWYDPDPMSTIIEEDVDLVKSYYERTNKEIDSAKISPWLLRIELNQTMMIDKKLSIAKIAEKIHLEFDDNLACIFSEDYAQKLILRIRIMNDEAPKAGLNDDSVEVIEDDVFLVKIASTMLTGMCLRGIPGISKVFVKNIKVKKFNNDEGFEVNSEWMLVTEGVNLLAVMCHKDIDATRTTSNHLVEVIEVLGIEAVRRSLLDELRAVISFDGSYINYRHFSILCDTMTYRGHLMAINQNNNGPMMRCSFEETADTLFNAAAFSETDYLRGIDEHIMLGQLAPIGTGYTACYLNEVILNEAIEVPGYTDEELDFIKAPPPPKRKRRSSYNETLMSPKALLSLRPNLPLPRGYTVISPMNSPSSPRYSQTNSPSSPGYIPTFPTYNQTSPSSVLGTPAYRPLYRYSPICPLYNPSVAHSQSSLRSSLAGALSPSFRSYRLSWPAHSLTGPSYPMFSPSRQTSVPCSPLRPTNSPTSSSGGTLPSSPGNSPSSTSQEMDQTNDEDS